MGVGSLPWGNSKAAALEGKRKGHHLEMEMPSAVRDAVVGMSAVAGKSLFTERPNYDDLRALFDQVAGE